MAGGKSYLLRWAALSFLIYQYGKTKVKNIPVGLFSEDYPTLKDRQIARIKREFPEWLGELKDSKDEGFAFYLKPEYGSGKIMLRNLDDPSKYMSSEFAGIFVEELTRNEEQTFEDLRNRLRYPGVEEVKFMGATNPGGIGHGWVKKYFIDKTTGDPEQERFFYVHANVYDNQFISESYIKQLEALPEQKRKAYLEGSWDVFAGQYYPEFNRRSHVCNPFMPSRLPNGKLQNVIVGGMDWGRVDPFAFYLAEVARVDYQGVKFYRTKVFLEVYGTENTPHKWSEIILEKMKFFNLKLMDISWIRADTQIYAKGLDGSALDIYSQFMQANEDWHVLQPANKDRIGGWENLHRWFSIAPDGLPYLQFSSNCKNAIETIPQLIHDDLKVEDVDSSGIDHSGDSVRYLCMALKWIDGTVGAAYHPQPNAERMPLAPQFIGEKQLSINLDRFGMTDQIEGSVGGVRKI